ncbi:hypothetical protein [Modestobacter versicolor]|uniref:Uncharacterized protein n=1 Tax=Modestobacter versicolor TaxID=429133 RepID=A0A839Y4N1_9ACTN|nr:hypothetical protein [Modestobacter versicolor]MBB3677695.1 hypothetical protein [Modestobacter versicolor]
MRAPARVNATLVPGAAAVLRGRVAAPGRGAAFAALVVVALLAMRVLPDVPSTAARAGP